MKKTIIIAVILIMMMTCVFAFAGCSSSDWSKVEKAGFFYCGITLYEPMNYMDGDDLVGFDTEFAKAVAAKLGLEAKFQIINWDSKYLELNSGAIDCIWNGFTVDDERKENVDFSVSYLNNSQCVVVKTSALADYANTASFEGKKGTAESGSAGESFAKDLCVDENKYTASTAQTAALTELIAGTADFAVVDVLLANSMVGTGDFSTLSKVTTVDLGSEEYAIGFRKGSDLTKKVNDAIAELIADGTLQTIAEKYGVENSLIK